MKTDRYGGHEGYLVRSLYFDSIYDEDYFDKVNGLNVRKKIRLRIYPPDLQNVKMELKQKQGAVQIKKSISIPKSIALKLIDGKTEALLELEGELPLEFYQIMKRGLYRPKCVIEYRRVAFVTETNNTRITIDSKIGATRTCNTFFEANPRLIPLMNCPTLEVKYNGFLFDHIKRAVNLADRLEVSSSKYEMARIQTF